MSSHKQTVSFLRGRFAEVGFKPYAKHGQNFLIDLNLLDLLAETAQLGRRDVALEVGTGTGSLTVRLADQAAAVVTVEIDPHLAQLAEEQFKPEAPITIVRNDALKNKNNFHPLVLETLRETLRQIPDARLKLAANLPYAVATPIISNLLTLDLPLESMTVTIQKELADRIVAVPRTKDYGSLSVWIQAQCQAEVIRILGPKVFWPRPKVDSAIVHIQVDHARRAAIADREWLHQFVRHLFLHRRKFLRSGLLAAIKSLDKPTVDQVMAELELGPKSRAEELSVAEIVRLADHIKQALSTTA